MEVSQDGRRLMVKKSGWPCFSWYAIAESFLFFFVSQVVGIFYLQLSIPLTFCDHVVQLHGKASEIEIILFTKTEELDFFEKKKWNSLEIYTDTMQQL